MLTHSTCGAEPYKQILHVGYYKWYPSINSCCACGGVYQWVVLGICCICGELPRALTHKGGESNTLASYKSIVVVLHMKSSIVSGFSTTLEV
jgi:hypothetical protein